MAVQRIGFLEMHFEKILAAGAAAGVIGVIGWQLASAPTVDVGKKKDIPLSSGMSELERVANQVKTDLLSKEPQKPDVPAVDIKSDFTKRSSAPVSGSKELAWAMPKLTGVSLGQTTQAADPLAVYVRIPNLPAPGKPVVAPHLSTIDATELVNNAGLAEFLPKTAPYDTASISIETSFDGAALRAEYQRDESAAKLKSLPRSWWANTEIVKVEVYRQEQKPDGTWSDAVKVADLPGRTPLAETLAKTDLDMGELVAKAKEHREEVLRPAFYARARIMGYPVGDDWFEPSQQNAVAEKGEEAKRLQQQLSDVLRKERNIKAAIERLRAPAATPTPRPGGRGPGGGGPGARGPGGGPAPQPSGPSTSEQQITKLQSDLKNIETEIANLRQKLQQLGVRTPQAKPPQPVGTDGDLSEILREGSVQVWTHDLGVQRGKTYRYQMRLGLTNPLYAQQRELKSDQNELSRQHVLYTAFSDWSDPVTTDPDVYSFVTSGNTRGGLNPTPTASAELYKFSWGYWRRARVALEPGDAFVGKTQVPDSEKVMSLPEANPGSAPNPAGPNVPPAGPAGPSITPGLPTQPSPGRGAAPNTPDPSGRGPRGAAPNTPSTPGNTPATPGAIEPLPVVEVSIADNAIMLDTVNAPETTKGIGGSQERPVQVFVRDPRGMVVVRIPAGEKASALYKRLDASADEGEKQLKGQFAGAPEPAPAPRPNRPQPDPFTPPPPQPGGGGGGGGGAGG